MAFDKVIISSIVRVAKSGNKMDLALDSLKDKLIQTTTTTIQKQIPVDLPFDVGDALQNGNLPTPSPSLLSTVKPIPEVQKQPINNTLDTLETTLNSTIQTKNQLQSSLETLTKPLDTITQLSTTLNGVLTGLDAAVTVIKAIPLPTSVPPGAGIPLNIINGFSDALDTLKSVIDSIKGPLGVIPPSIKELNQILIPIVNKLNLLDPVFESMIKLISFIRLLLLFGPNATQQEIDSILQETASKITESSEAVGLTSNSEENKRLNQELLDRLNPNSNNPLFYKDFKLTIEYDPNNTYSFASRRVKGFKEEGNITLYNLDDTDGENGADYSFSATPVVLVKEIEYKIDQYLLEKRYAPIGFPGEIDGQKIGYKNKIYQWNLEKDEWEEIPIPTFQAIVIRSEWKRTAINLRRLEIKGSYINSFNQPKTNINILPQFVEYGINENGFNSPNAQFLDWPSKKVVGGWVGGNIVEYPASAIIFGSLDNKINIHTFQDRRNSDNALLIPLKQPFNLNSVSKVTLYNRHKGCCSDRINGFQIEFYKSKGDVLNGGNPILVIPITGEKDRYDWTFQQIRDLQPL